MVSRFYSASSFWNVPISSNPTVDPHSAAIVSKSIASAAGSANFANTDGWGIGLVYASAGDKTYTIPNATYYNTGPVSFKIPAGAKPTTDSDHHLVVIDGTKEFDMWDAHYNASTDTWTAGSRFITDLNGWGAMASPGQRAGGAVAAGFAEMGGVVRPEEIAQGHIDHALSITVPLIRAGYIAAPATATDGSSTDPASIPEGAHLQLNPQFNVDAQNWPTWEKVIAKALQTYGAYVSDHGGTLAVYGQTDMNAGNTSWASTGTPKGGSLSNLPWDQMRVLTIPSASTGQSTSFDPSGGAASTPPAGSPPSAISISLGSGSHSLLVKVSETAYLGDAQYTIKVDGQQIGGTQTAHASHTLGQSDQVTLHGNWAAGNHTATVTFLNDAYAGTPTTDRNLYVDGMAMDGIGVSGGSASLYSSGPHDFIFHV